MHSLPYAAVLLDNLTVFEGYLMQIKGGSFGFLQLWGEIATKGCMLGEASPKPSCSVSTPDSEALIRL